MTDLSWSTGRATVFAVAGTTSATMLPSRGREHASRGVATDRELRRRLVPSRNHARTADERHHVLVRRPLLRGSPAEPRVIPQGMLCPPRAVSRLACSCVSRRTAVVH